MIPSSGRKAGFATLLSLVTLCARPVAGQGPTLFVLDVAGTPVGEIPAGIKQLQGILEVVIKDGQPMLKASARSEFLITLPRVLPAAFTLEFDLVPKVCLCNPQDLSFEGTPAINQGGSSAHVLWDSDGSLQIIGGGQTYDAPMPEEFRTTLPGVLTNVVVTVDGPTIKLYTNGRRLYTLDRQFARGRVLRVFLGGQDNGANAVHLAGLRISAGAGGAGGIAAAPAAPVQGQPPSGQTTPPPGRPAPQPNPPQGQPVPQPNPPQGQPAPPPGTATQSQGLTGGPVPTIVSNVTVTQGPAGPVVSWLGGAAPTVYTVSRWKIDDPICCNSASPLNPALTGPPWQDAPPPLSGTYVYEVSGRTNAGIASAQTQFAYLNTGGGQIVGPAGSRNPVPVTPAPVTPTVPAPISGALGVPAPSGFNVTVTLEASGPVVSWSPVPTATGYAVSRLKVGDPCCNASSGRTALAGSPWQDSPLPMTGTYEYLVLAVTPLGMVRSTAQFGFRMPAGPPPAPAPAPVVAVPVAPPTGTMLVPPPAPASVPPSGGTILNPPRGVGTAVAGNTGPPPDQVSVRGTPIVATVWWYVPQVTQFQPNGITYRVSRAVAGTMNFTVLTPVPQAAMSLEDILPDRTLTYTYAVTALHPNGTQGTATVDFTAPPPADPTDFVATVTGVDEVKLTWSATPGPAQYFLTGPGTGSGVAVTGAPTTSGPGGRHQPTHVIKGLPPGTHTWKIASSYVPGGILTQSSQWSTATATMAAVGKYEISIESVKVNGEANDNFLHADGLRNEFYVTALVRSKDQTGNILTETTHKSATHGDISNLPGPARVRAGSAGSNGGVVSGDLISPIWGQPSAGATGWTRFVLWSGTLTAGVETLEIAPAIWEADNPGFRPGQGPVTYDDLLRRVGYSILDLDTRTYWGNISNALVAGHALTGFLGFHITLDEDRPIGIAKQNDPLNDAAAWYPVAIQVNHKVAEAALSGAYGPAGLIPIQFVDHKLLSKDPITLPDLGSGDYILSIRIKRLP